MLLDNLVHIPMLSDFPLEQALKCRSAAIACSSEKSSALISGLEAMGATALTLNVIALQPMPDNRDLDAALDQLDRYDWIILSSTHGAHFFVRRLQERGIALKQERTPHICAIGPATRKTLEKCGLQVDLIPEEFVAEGILLALVNYYGNQRNLAGRRILLPRAQKARDLLPQALAAAGAVVDVVSCYRNVLGSVPENVVLKLKTAPPDLLVFTSSSAVKNFVTIMGDEEAERMLHAATTAALGPITAATLQTFGKKADILPEENTIPSLLEAIRQHFSKHSFAGGKH
jgi:uroporphyrinogen III methyltransferase/synthase